jgi:hypothetical protein
MSACAWNKDVHEIFHKFKVRSLPWVLSECIDYHYQLDFNFCSKCSYRLLPDIIKNARWSPLTFTEDLVVRYDEEGVPSSAQIIVHDCAPVAMIIRHKDVLVTDQKKMIELARQTKGWYNQEWRDEPVYNNLPVGMKCTECSSLNRGRFEIADDGLDVSQCPLMHRVLADAKNRYAESYDAEAGVYFAAYLYPYLSILPRRWKPTYGTMQTSLIKALNVSSNLQPSESLRRILTTYEKVLKMSRMPNKFTEVFAYSPEYYRAYDFVVRGDCPVAVYRANGNDVTTFDKERIEQILLDLEEAILCGEVI